MGTASHYWASPSVKRRKKVTAWLAARMVVENRILSAASNVAHRTDQIPGIDVGWRMLHEFLASNRTVLIERCRVRAAGRHDAQGTEDELAHGIPKFLDQIIGTLMLEQTLEPHDTSATVRDLRGDLASEVGTTAALHGRDLFREGFTIEQVVRDYGAVCQAVTALAIETGAPIGVDEFRTFNRCLDNAIAGAVTEYSKHAPVLNDHSSKSAQDLRKNLNAAILAVTAMKSGSVGSGGATATILDRSLMAMHEIISH